MAVAKPLTFDLVVATVDRVDELGRLLRSLERQTHRAFRVLLTDQNPDARIERVVSEHSSLDIVHLRTSRGLSHARNAALGHLRGDLVAFPDDDCEYPDDLLERVAKRFASRPDLDGLTGRPADAAGRSSPSWRHGAAVLTRNNLWNRGISFAIFFRADVAAGVGGFDEQLGLGSGAPWSSGEEIDYLIRAIDSGARIEYDPSVVVKHEEKPFSPTTLRELGARDGATIGYLLRKHRYPRRLLARMLVRPAGGAVLAFARRDSTKAQFHLSTLRGRILGYRGA